MANNGSGFYYVYALKDPRQRPAGPFYIGKGVGARYDQHLMEPDASPKGRRIREIRKTGQEPIVERLVTDLTETAAFRVEAELISAFGIEANGGILTNQIMPTGQRRRVRSDLIVPAGALEKAQVGLALVKTAVMDLVRANAGGISNRDATNALGLQSDYRGSSLNYLSYSVIGLLMREGKIKRTGLRNAQRHTAIGG